MGLPHAGAYGDFPIAVSFVFYAPIVLYAWTWPAQPFLPGFFTVCRQPCDITSFVPRDALVCGGVRRTSCRSRASTPAKNAAKAPEERPNSPESARGRRLAGRNGF